MNEWEGNSGIVEQKYLQIAFSAALEQLYLLKFPQQRHPCIIKAVKLS